jgi:hypothetical protein
VNQVPHYLPSAVRWNQISPGTFTSIGQTVRGGFVGARGKAMVHATFFYMVVIVLSVGVVASYFIPLP